MQKIPDPEGLPGFTRVDLCGLIASASLAGLLLLSMGNMTRTVSEATGCQNNSRRLIQAWQGYSSDNPALIPNTMDDRAWAKGFLSWQAGPDGTNRSTVQTPAFAPYVSSDIALFRCPSDRFVSAAQRSLGWRTRLRSYSMNYYVGQTGFDPFVTGFKRYLKESDFGRPSQTIVFTDEHPDSIDDPLFRGDPSAGRDGASNIPASFHDLGAVLGFADGRVELHRWQGSHFVRPVKFTFLELRPTKEVDFNWLAQRISELVR